MRKENNVAPENKTKVSMSLDVDYNDEVHWTDLNKRWDDYLRGLYNNVGSEEFWNRIYGGNMVIYADERESKQRLKEDPYDRDNRKRH